MGISPGCCNRSIGPRTGLQVQEARLIKRKLQETGKKAQLPEDQPGAESIASARADEDTYD